MNWKALLMVVVVASFVGSLVYGAIWGSDEIDGQVDRVEQSIVETLGDERWSFTDPECPRFDALEDGEKTTCTATAVDSGDGSEAEARIVVTLEDCAEGSGDMQTIRCDYSSQWKVG